MYISWHGQCSLRLGLKDAVIVIDPYAPSVGLSPFRSKADVVVLSNPTNKEMSHLAGVQGDYSLFDTPGEYSIAGTSLQAVPWQADDGSERSIQRWTIEGMTILNLGSLNRPLSDNELQSIESVGIDILLVPVGGGPTLDSKMALGIVHSIEPRIVIPIHFALPKLKVKIDSVDQFAKEMGAGSTKREKKFTVRANRLPQDDMETVILEP